MHYLIKRFERGGCFSGLYAARAGICSCNTCTPAIPGGRIAAFKRPMDGLEASPEKHPPLSDRIKKTKTQQSSKIHPQEKISLITKIHYTKYWYACIYSNSDSNLE